MNPEKKSVWLDPSDCVVDELKNIIDGNSSDDNLQHAIDVQNQIPIYSGQSIVDRVSDVEFARDLMTEWNLVFEQGAGVIIVKRAYPDIKVIDLVTEVLSDIIKEESSAGGADHFAAAGANSRVWNSHEKLAIANPQLFADYYANPVMHLASRAWLGPNYQITAQVNVVHPGGRAQVCHRDYHLGFQSIEQLSAYPLNVQRLSPHLTLQGAIAHSTMTLESGPTKVLPFSQQYAAGYMAAQLPEFQQFFENSYVQYPLATGDMMFFNPAVFHAAGDNKTSDDRFANLLQIGSAFSRTTELVDRTRLCRLLYPVLLEAQRSKTMTDQDTDFVIAASAEGYAFPCNLDLTPPVDGLAPDSQQQIMQTSLNQNMTPDEFNRILDTWVSLQRS